MFEIFRGAKESARRFEIWTNDEASLLTFIIADQPNPKKGSKPKKMAVKTEEEKAEDLLFAGAVIKGYFY